jgi:hypothetical protein
MSQRIVFAQEMQVSRQDSAVMTVIVTGDQHTPGWLARLVAARSGNRLNVFYYREYMKETMVSEVGKVYLLADGVYEVEFKGNNGPHRIAFETRQGSLVWGNSITLAKKLAMDRIQQALASQGLR